MKPVEFIRGWINRYFAHEEALLLLVLIGLGLVLVVWLGGTLAPVLTALVLAFILQGAVARLQHWRVPDRIAVYIAYLLFVSIVAIVLLIVFPLIWRQLAAFIEALPGMIDQLRTLARALPERYPTLITPEQIDQWVAGIRVQLVTMGQRLLTLTFTQIGSVVSIIIYLVLVPILVFFFLNDRVQLIAWFKALLPDERPLLRQVGDEMNQQIANYVRGKALEIFIVGGVTYAVFSFLGVDYAALLSLLVGLSVVVPFVGAAVVTIPVALVAFVQFGWTLDFGWVVLAYAVIQALDGNVLVPVLFSEAVDLHPVAIIVAVLAFGGIWGFWGVFFAIPLASLIKAVLSAWPKTIRSPLHGER
ncbi:MAG: AI-2E family transporter [Pseudomonadales bacterium]|jgi:putative permease|nr:AI-2E family transporter [Pseudomonadales bacterium]